MVEKMCQANRVPRRCKARKSGTLEEAEVGPQRLGCSFTATTNHALPALSDCVASIYCCAICGSPSSRWEDFSPGKERHSILSTGRSCLSRIGNLREHICPLLCFSLNVNSPGTGCLYPIKWGSYGPLISGILYQIRHSRTLKEARTREEMPGRFQVYSV